MSVPTVLGDRHAVRNCHVVGDPSHRVVGGSADDVVAKFRLGKSRRSPNSARSCPDCSPSSPSTNARSSRPSLATCAAWSRTYARSASPGPSSTEHPPGPADPGARQLMRRTRYALPPPLGDASTAITEPISTGTQVRISGRASQQALRRVPSPRPGSEGRAALRFGSGVAFRRCVRPRRRDRNRDGSHLSERV